MRGSKADTLQSWTTIFNSLDLKLGDVVQGANPIPPFYFPESFPAANYYLLSLAFIWGFRSDKLFLNPWLFPSITDDVPSWNQEVTKDFNPDR